MKPKKKRIMPMATFWRRNKCLYLCISLVLIITEVLFLVGSIVVTILNYKSERCEDHEVEERLRAALIVTELLHSYNIARNIYKVYVTFQDIEDVRQTLLKCLILDCYCSIATIGYAFIQIIFFGYGFKC